MLEIPWMSWMLLGIVYFATLERSIDEPTICISFIGPLHNVFAIGAIRPISLL